MSAREGAAPGQAARVVDVSDLARKIQDTWDSEFSRATDTALDYRMARTAVEVTLAAAAAAQPASGDLAVVAGRLGYALAALDMIVLYHGDGALGIAERALTADKAIRERSGQPAPAPAAADDAALQRTYRQAAEAERDRLRTAIKHEIEQLEQSAAATMPSKKSVIEAGLAERLATWMEGP